MKAIMLGIFLFALVDANNFKGVRMVLTVLDAKESNPDTIQNVIKGKALQIGSSAAKFGLKVFNAGVDKLFSKSKPEGEQKENDTDKQGIDNPEEVTNEGQQQNDNEILEETEKENLQKLDNGKSDHCIYCVEFEVIGCSKTATSSIQKNRFYIHRQGKCVEDNHEELSTQLKEQLEIEYMLNTSDPFVNEPKFEEMEFEKMDDLAPFTKKKIAYATDRKYSNLGFSYSTNDSSKANALFYGLRLDKPTCFEFINKLTPKTVYDNLKIKVKWDSTSDGNLLII